MGRWEDLEPHLVKDFGKYNSSSPKHLRFMSRQQFLKYSKKSHRVGGYEFLFKGAVNYTDPGFDVDDCAGFMPGRIVPIPKASKEWAIAQKIAAYAAICYEEQLVKRRPMRSVELIKANYQTVRGFMYYLTFRGVDSECVEATYRTKVWLKPGPSMEPLFFAKVPGSEVEPKSKNEVNEKAGGKLGAHGFYLLMAQMRREKPNLKYKMAKKAASRKWRSLSEDEKLMYREDAAKVIEVHGRINLSGV